MMQIFKDVQGYQWCIGIMITIIIALAGLGYTETKAKIDEKASNESVQRIQKVIELRQEMLLDERREQKILNKELLKAIQNLTIQTVILNEKQKKDKNDD